MTRPKIDHSTTTTTADMAAILGISVRRLQQLAAEGWVDGKTARGEWNVFLTTHTYLAFSIRAGRKAA